MLNNEIKNASIAYSVMKRDLHTLLVKESKSPIDYIGKIEVHPYFVTLTYPIEENKQSQETYHAVVDVSVLLENMLKDDLRLWEKTSGLKWLEIAPDHRCETVVMEIGFFQK